MENVKPIISGMSCEMRQAPIVVTYSLSEMAQGPLVQYFGAPSYNFSTSGVSAGRWALHVASLQLAWSEGEGKKKGRRWGEFPSNLGKALGQLGPCTAPGVVLFSEDPPSEIAQPYGLPANNASWPFPKSQSTQEDGTSCKPY
jgi:hypothetical protein